MTEDIYFFDLPKVTAMTYTKDMPILTNEQAVMQSIMNILQTEKGTRVYAPDFGCSLNKFMFAQADFMTARDMMSEVKNQILKYEPRIRDLNVVVTMTEDDNIAQIDISFIIDQVGMDKVENMTTYLNKVTKKCNFH